jgi:hypothetical protein
MIMMPIEAVYAGSAKGVYYRSDTSSNWLNYSKNLPTISDIQDLMMYNDGGGCSKLVVSYYGREHVGNTAHQQPWTKSCFYFSGDVKYSQWPVCRFSKYCLRPGNS